MKAFLIKITVLAGLVGLIVYYYQLAEERKRAMTEYQRDSNMLADRLKKIYQEKIELEEKNEILEKEAEKDRAVFDWYLDISNSAVVKRLREN